MDFNIRQEAIAINEAIYEGSMEHPLDCDITLPDYCPDILRILKCQVIPQVSGYQTAGDRLTVDGTVLIRLLYIDEECGKVCVHESNSNFSKSMELKNMPDSPYIKVKACVDYVNCRAVSSRRLDVHGSFSLHIKICLRKQEEFITGAEGAGIQLEKKEISLSSMKGQIQRQFMLDEVMEIGQSKAPILQVIRTDCRIVLNDQKVITNKLLIKGDLLIKCLYAYEAKGNALEVIENSIPFSQIIDMEGVSDECHCDINLQLLSLELQPKADTNGEMRLLNMVAKINASVSASQNIEAAIVTDAYSTLYKLHTEARPVEFEKLIETFKDTCVCKKTFEVGSGGVSSVLDVWCSNLASTAKMEDQCLCINGTFMVCLLLLDGAGAPCYLERDAQFNYKRELKTTAEKILCEPEIVVNACDFNLSNAENVDVRITLGLEGSVFEIETENMIVTLKPDEESKKECTTAALTIYFADAGETVWNIARHYNTTVEAIMAENELQSNIIGEKRMLLIPCI